MFKSKFSKFAMKSLKKATRLNITGGSGTYCRLSCGVQVPCSGTSACVFMVVNGMPCISCPSTGRRRCC